MDKVIEIKNLNKKYGKVIALDGINLSLDRGEVVGLLGPNGSGKSSLIKSIAGLVRPDSGSILLMDKKIGAASKSEIAYLADRPYFYEGFKVADIVKVYSDFFADFDRGLMEQYIDHLYLEKNAKVDSLSKGDMDKLAISLNLARQASIYLFDEPLDGIDPISAGKIISLLLDKMDGEKTFIISTHQIKTMENLFDRVIFLNQGQVQIDAPAKTIRKESQMALSDYYDYAYMG